MLIFVLDCIESNADLISDNHISSRHASEDKIETTQDRTQEDSINIYTASIIILLCSIVIAQAITIREYDKKFKSRPRATSFDTEDDLEININERDLCNTSPVRQDLARKLFPESEI